MQKVLLCTFLFATLFSLSSSAQVYLNKDSSLTLSGYADGYYAYYTDSVGAGNFQKFPTTAARSNSFGLNIAMLGLKYTTDKLRAVITLHYGDIPLSAWASKYNNIQEAYAGVRISKKLWADIGFFRTHIDAESALPKENITASVTVATYHEPYYEAGARLSYKPNSKLSFDLYVLNGYNLYEDNNDKKSFGLLATYACNDALSIGYSNYIGSNAERGDSISRFRNYENVFLNYQKKRIKMQAGFNFCNQRNADTLQNSTANLFSGFATARYSVCSKAGVYARGEFFNDASGFLSGSFTDKINRTTGVKLWGVTVGTEFKPTENSYIRLEGRELQCEKNQQIFRWRGTNKSNRSEIIFLTGIYF